MLIEKAAILIQMKEWLEIVSVWVFRQLRYQGSLLPVPRSERERTQAGSGHGPVYTNKVKKL